MVCIKRTGYPRDISRARIGIGAATGADDIYIVSGSTADEIETDRLVPLAMRSDIQDGRLGWSGQYIIYTFRDGGGAVTK